MADDLLGFIPRVLQLDDVTLLRADEAVLNAMVDGYFAVIDPACTSRRRICAPIYDRFSPP